MIRGIVISVLEGLIKLFSATGRLGESFANREYFQHYGYTSRPLAGAEIIIIREGNHILGIASDDRRYRLALENGEVALYTDEGDFIHLKRDKTIHIVSGNKLIADIANEVDINTKVAKVVASVSCDVNSPVITVEAPTSCEVTSPAITINAAASVVVNSPSVLLGGSLGTMRFLADERSIATYNGHTHPYGGAPSPQMSVEGDCTQITKGA